MKAPRVAVVSTGSANLASVRRALLCCGFQSDVITAPVDFDRYDAVILPGVGSFGAAMHQLAEEGFVGPLCQEFVRVRPFLAICLGLQLLADRSDESPGVAGLGLVRGRIERLPDSSRLPQMGWNRISAPAADTVVSGYGYFANSYALRTSPEGWNASTVEHGVTSIAALRRGPQLACQFHPELSGRWGAELLSRWRATW